MKNKKILMIPAAFLLLLLTILLIPAGKASAYTDKTQTMPLTFDSGDRSSDASVTINVYIGWDRYGQKGYVMPKCPFTTEEGYEFAGWLIGKDFIAQPDECVSFNNFSQYSTGPVTALWQGVEFKLEVVAMAGDFNITADFAIGGKMDPVLCRYDKAMLIPECTLTSDGGVHYKWYIQHRVDENHDWITDRYYFPGEKLLLSDLSAGPSVKYRLVAVFKPFAYATVCFYDPLGVNKPYRINLYDKGNTDISGSVTIKNIWDLLPEDYKLTYDERYKPCTVLTTQMWHEDTALETYTDITLPASLTGSVGKHEDTFYLYWEYITDTKDESSDDSSSGTEDSSSEGSAGDTSEGTSSGTEDGSSEGSAGDSSDAAEIAAAKSNKLTFIATATAGKKSHILTWTSCKNADFYIIYCSVDGGKFKRLKKLPATEARTYTVKKTGTSVRSYKIVAYKKTSKASKKLATSFVCTCASSKNKQFTNASEVIRPFVRKTLKAGSQVQFTASVSLTSDKKLLPPDTCEITYLSSNTDIAVVSSDGRITALKAGRCYIYAISANGLYTRCRITVK